MPSSSVIEAKFKRANLEMKNTFLWKDASFEIKSDLSKKLELQEKEEPIILYSKNSNYSWVITRLRLILFDHSTTVSYNFDSFDRVELKDLINENSNKQTNDSMVLVFKNGTYLDIKVEIKTWYIIYDILKFLIGQ